MFSQYTLNHTLTNQSPYTNGQTIIHTQPNYTLEPQNIQPSHFFGQTQSQVEPEKIITDNIIPTVTYPFNLNTDCVSDIELKLENTVITIENSKIISNKPLFIKYNGNVLYVWNVVSYPNKIIGSKGNTFMDGYNVLDFDNSNVKSVYQFGNTEWDNYL